MKQTVTLLLSCMAGILALNLSLADEKQDIEMAQKVEELTEENTLLVQTLRVQYEYGPANPQNEILKVAEKMESDLRAVTKTNYHEEMDIHVKIEEVVAGEFRANIGIATSLAKSRYGGLVQLVEKTVSMDDVQVMIVTK